jgi:tetratricopeptide (TPR) repeat protein
VSLAFLLSAQGRSDEATAKLSEADQKFPGLPALHKAKGEVYLGQGRYEEARSELQAALGIQEDLGTRFRLGVTLRRMRAFDEAARAFDEVAAGDKDFPGLALERGLLFEETGQSDKAVEMYSSALAKAPTDVDLKLRVASAQVMAGRGEQAEKALREILRERNSAEANHYLGRAMMLQGPSKLGDALRHLERAVELDGNRAEYHLFVGWAANDGGQPQKAETALKKAIELDQGNGDAWWQKGSLLRKQGATIDAIASLEKAIERRPSRYEAYADLALCFQEQAKWAEAEAALRKAIAGNPKNPRWHFMLGKVLDKMGNKAGTIEPLEKAVALLTTDEQRKQYFEAYFLLGEAYGAAQRDKSVAAYQKFLEVAPDGNAYRVDAQRALAALGAPQR